MSAEQAAGRRLLRDAGTLTFRAGNTSHDVGDGFDDDSRRLGVGIFGGMGSSVHRKSLRALADRTLAARTKGARRSDLSFAMFAFLQSQRFFQAAKVYQTPGRHQGKDQWTLEPMPPKIQPANCRGTPRPARPAGAMPQPRHEVGTAIASPSFRLRPALRRSSAWQNPDRRRRASVLAVTDLFVTP